MKSNNKFKWCLPMFCAQIAAGILLATVGQYAAALLMFVCAAYTKIHHCLLTQNSRLADKRFELVCENHALFVENEWLKSEIEALRKTR